MNILRKCHNQNQVKEIENGQQPAPRKIATPQNVGVAILRGAGCGLLAIFYFLYLVLGFDFGISVNTFIYSFNVGDFQCLYSLH